KGYSEVLVDGERKSLRDRINLTKTKKHDISVLVDSISFDDFQNDKENAEMRLSEAIEKSIDESDGLLVLRFRDLAQKGRTLSTDSQGSTLGSAEFLLSAKWACPKDGFSFPEIEPRLFSFNSPYGACSECNGLGTKYLFGDESCDKCKGARLREEALAVRIGEKNIVELAKLSIKECDEFFKNLELTEREKSISHVVIKEIQSRL